MGKRLANFIEVIYGKPHKSRSKKIIGSIIALLLTVTFAVIMIQNVSCGWDRKGKFYFKYEPAIDQFNVDIKKGLK